MVSGSVSFGVVREVMFEEVECVSVVVEENSVGGCITPSRTFFITYEELSHPPEPFTNPGILAEV